MSTTTEATDVPTYRVSTWDHHADDWSVVAAGVPLMALRGWLRDLEGLGWDRGVSILVYREARS